VYLESDLRILFLTQIIPYPPDSGPKVKTWHLLRYLADRGHQIYLVSFIRPEEEGHVDPLRQVCADVITVPIRRSRLANLSFYLRCLFTGRPYLVERDDLVAMRRCLQGLMQKVSFDYIHADQLTMVQFGLPRPGLFSGYRGYSGSQAVDKDQPRLVFDAHNAVWTIVERMGQNMPWYLQPVLREETRRVRLYEGMLVQRCDHTLAVTEIDRQMLLQARDALNHGGPGRPPSITVVPIAVDTNVLQPVFRQPGSTNLLTLGTLHYPPNADGIRWFLQEVFPRVLQSVPDARLTIVGKNPPQDFQELAKKQAGKIVVTGYVPNVTPYLEKSALMVVPVRAGSGMRVRILEAFAQAMPVVTTTKGLEGIDAKPGEDVLVADTPQDYAAAVVQLLRDISLQRKLATNGRHLAESRYDWRVVLQKMDQVYGNNRSETSPV
jgi:glycosyltransferase involved in cell wall biosynthesis